MGWLSKYFMSQKERELEDACLDAYKKMAESAGKSSENLLGIATLPANVAPRVITLQDVRMARYLVRIIEKIGDSVK